jgi:hypothetical protein
MIFCVYLQVFSTFRMRFVRENFNETPLFISNVKKCKEM